MHQTLVLLFVLQITITCIYALQCYECRSPINGHCDDPINNNTVPYRNCKWSHFIDEHGYHKEYECIKFIERNNRTNATIIGRHCIVKTQNNYCERYKHYQGLYGCTVDSCYTCGSDLCNSGHTIKAKFVLLSVFLFGLMTKILWN